MYKTSDTSFAKLEQQKDAGILFVKSKSKSINPSNHKSFLPAVVTKHVPSVIPKKDIISFDEGLKWSDQRKAVVSGVAGTSVLLASTFLLGFGLFTSVLFGATMWLGSTLFMGPDPYKKIAKVSGLSKADISGILDSSANKVKEIHRLNDNIPGEDISKRLDDICVIATDILQFLMKNPEDIKKSRDFLNQYLDSTLEITRKVAKFHGQRLTPEMKEAFDQFDQLLYTVDDAFRKQYEHLQRHEVLGLEVDIEVLKTSLEHEAVR